MGGCRCTFRGCPNNSANSPGMHFFHYPFKCPDRFKLWTKYANTKNFLDIPENKARNKVVCETHFRDECFMNYRKERLVQFAIPTIVRLPNGMVLDYEQSESPKPKLLEPTKSKHLIRPNTLPRSPAETASTSAGSASSGNEDDYVIEAIEEYTVTQKRSFTSTFDPNDTDVIKSKILKKTISPRILNSGVRQSSTPKKVHSPPRFVNLDTLPTPKKEILSNNDICDEITIEPIEEDDEEHLSTVDITFEGDEQETTSLLQNKSAEPQSKSPTFENVSKSVYDEAIAAYELKIEELKQKLEEKEAAEKAQTTTQVETVSTSRPPAATSNNTATLTKAQFFNGIKKYLSPSMATLVRMEMFGGPERQWKKDEKDVSVELLKLGESVFNYFRDEWRFRLPPKKDVEQWLSTSDNIEEEDDI